MLAVHTIAHFGPTCAIHPPGHAARPHKQPAATKHNNATAQSPKAFVTSLATHAVATTRRSAAPQPAPRLAQSSGSKLPVLFATRCHIFSPLNPCRPVV